MERGANSTAGIDHREIREGIERGHPNRRSGKVFDECGTKDVFDSLNKEILDEAGNLKMHAYENFASFLARKFAKINDAWEKFERYLEN